MTALKISNRQARWLWLAAQGLAGPPVGRLDLAAMIHELGFVQLDTIRVISRAHHHILWSRNQNYREPMLGKLLKSRGVFEHYTHDASVLPMEFLPHWRRQFRRRAEYIVNAGWWKGMPDADGRAEIRALFKSSKVGNIAGCLVQSGIMRRNAKARLLRDNVVIAENLTISSLRREKDDVTEVREGYECGLTVTYSDIKEGDVIETYELVEKART